MAGALRSQGQITTTAKKPVEILRILPRCHFFNAPKDIRLMIYEEVLVRTTLYNRRHSKTCYLYNHDGMDGQLTPFMNMFWNSYDHENNEFQLPPCDTQCHHRDGMALLRTNKQIYHEASDIFFSKNTFSFPSLKDALWAAELNRQWRTDTIRRLTIWDAVTGDRATADTLHCYSPLRHFPNLEYIEVPFGVFFPSGSSRQIFELTPKIRTLVVRWLRWDWYQNGFEEIPICMGIERTWHFPKCKAYERHDESWSRYMLSHDHCCWKHGEKLKEIEKLSSEWSFASLRQMLAQMARNNGPSYIIAQEPFGSRLQRQRWRCERDATIIARDLTASKSNSEMTSRKSCGFGVCRLRRLLCDIRKRERSSIVMEGSSKGAPEASSSSSREETRTGVRI